jgi:hypothetical protein
MRLTSSARVALVACAAVTALVLAAASNAEARATRAGGYSSQSGGSNVMGPGGNGPIVNTPTWRNNQGGLLGGTWPPPKRHPCSTPGNPNPGYSC